MAQYKIYAGLGGGFGGAQYIGTETFETEQAAYDYAFECACEEYDSYEGLHGLTLYNDIYENPEDYGLDEDATEEEIEDAFSNEREGWIEYYVKKVV